MQPRDVLIFLFPLFIVQPMSCEFEQCLFDLKEDKAAQKGKFVIIQFVFILLLYQFVVAIFTSSTPKVVNHKYVYCPNWN